MNRVSARNADKIEAIQFPQTRNILWDHTSTGSPTDVHLTSYRTPRALLAHRTLNLAHHYAKDNKVGEPFSCLLVGCVNYDTDDEGVTIVIDRFDRGVYTHKGLKPSTDVPGDLYIPCTVFCSHESGVGQEYGQVLRKLQKNAHSKDKLDYSNFLSVLARCSCEARRDRSTCLIELDIVTMDTYFLAAPVMAIPILPTALSKNLLGPLNLSGVQGEAKSGYLTMNNTRKLVLILECDPKSATLPLVGVWISGISYIYHPYVWMACLRYLHNDCIQDRVCFPPEPFLVVLYSPLRNKPEFYDVTRKSESQCLDFQLYSACETVDIVKNVPGDSMVVLDFSLTQNSDKDAAFRESVEEIKQGTSPKSKKLSSIPTSFTPEDFLPRASPSPHSSRAPSVVRPSVPDVSLIDEENINPQGPTLGNLTLKANLLNHYQPNVPLKKTHQSTRQPLKPRNGDNHPPQPDVFKSRASIPRSWSTPSFNEVDQGIEGNRQLHVQGCLCLECAAQQRVHHAMPNGTRAHHVRPELTNGDPRRRRPQSAERLHCGRLVHGPQWYPDQAPHRVPHRAPRVYGLTQDSDQGHNHSLHCPCMGCSTGRQLHWKRFPHPVPGVCNQYHMGNVPSPVGGIPNPRGEGGGRSPQPRMQGPYPIEDPVTQEPYPRGYGPEPRHPMVPYPSCQPRHPMIPYPTSNYRTDQDPNTKALSRPQNKNQPGKLKKETEEVCQAPCDRGKRRELDTVVEVAALDSGRSVSDPKSSHTNKDTVPTEVYQLLKQQDAQLKQLQDQIQRLLHAQTGPAQDSVMPAKSTFTAGSSESQGYMSMEATPRPASREMCSIATNTSVFWPTKGKLQECATNTSMTVDTSRSSHAVQQTEYSEELYGGTAGESDVRGEANTRDSPSEQGAGHRNTGCNNSDVSFGSVCMPQEVTVKSFVSEMMVDIPSYQSSPERNDDAEGDASFGSPFLGESASMCERPPTMNRKGDDGENDVIEGSGEAVDVAPSNQLGLLITNIRGLLARHSRDQDGSSVPSSTVNRDNGNSGETESVAGGRNGANHESADQSSMERVTQETLKQLKLMGVESILEDHQSKQSIDDSAYDVNTCLIPRLNYVSLVLDDLSDDPDLSVEVNALAMKYLSDDQLTELARLSKQRHTGRSRNLLQQVLTGSRLNASPNVTLYGMSASNMSFATQKYMEKYGLISKSKIEKTSLNPVVEDNIELGEEIIRNARSCATPKVKFQNEQSKQHGRNLEMLRRGMGIDDVTGQEADEDYTTMVLAGLPHPNDVTPFTLPEKAADDDNVLDMVRLRQLPKLL